MDQEKDALKRLFEEASKPTELVSPESSSLDKDKPVTQKHRTAPNLDHPRGCIQFVHLHNRLRELLEYVDKQFQEIKSLVSLLPAFVRSDDEITTLKMKEVAIGSWDMDATGNVSVAHGVSVDAIRQISVTIESDSNTFYTTGYGGAYASDPVANDLWVGYYDSVSIVLFRRSSGDFDNSDFDDTTMNRGYITITYVG